MPQCRNPHTMDKKVVHRLFFTTTHQTPTSQLKVSLFKHVLRGIFSFGGQARKHALVGALELWLPNCLRWGIKLSQTFIHPSLQWIVHLSHGPNSLIINPFKLNDPVMTEVMKSSTYQRNFKRQWQPKQYPAPLIINFCTNWTWSFNQIMECSNEVINAQLSPCRIT